MRAASASAAASISAYAAAAASASAAVWAAASASARFGLNSQNPPKIRIKKFLKLTGYTYACNSLTNIEYEAHAKTENGNYRHLLKLT